MIKYRFQLYFYSICFLVGIVSCKNKENHPQNIINENEIISYNFDVRPILSDKCFACHGPDAKKREADLRLDQEQSALAALKDNLGKYALVPGKPEESEVYHRIIATDKKIMMPPPESNLFLNEQEITILKKWIEQGAKYEKHWAFTKIEKPQVPESDWGNNEIDRFIYKKLKSKGLEPNERAGNYELIKRLCIDLTGLPPKPELIQRYKDFKAPNTYEKLVDELLAEKSYGEKLAVLWLDISRYSDSYGYQDDNIRTQWPYRDWVIHALNENMPYDQFITWQLAGDLLPNASKEQILATAFNRNHKYTEEGGIIPEEYRIEYVLDKTNTFSKGILGMTLECAQCHDHKYDPVSQKEYYELFAFFNNSKEKGFEGDVSQSKPAKTPILYIDKKETQEILQFINHQDTNQLMVSVMEELDEKEKRTTYILDRGVYDAKTIPVEPSTPGSILRFSKRYEKNRLGLAQWAVSKDNPLTARVFTNLIWQEIFGKGIVKSSGDFGMQGDLPTHPELLNWLAADFMENNWDIKRLIKKIVTSSTYQQSSKLTDKHLKVDPDNIFYARAPRLRFTAENIQDFVLASSGLLVDEIGGPSVKGYQPDGLWEAATSGRGVLATYVQDHGNKIYRRGIYNFIKLTVSPPKAIMFDGSNRDRCEVGRGRTNTPLQALVMLNDPMVLEASRVLAIKLNKKHATIDSAIEDAFIRIISRPMRSREKTYLKDYFEQELAYYQKNKDKIGSIMIVGEYPIDTQDMHPKNAALMQLIVSLYNLEEAITKI